MNKRPMNETKAAFCRLTSAILNIETKMQPTLKDRIHGLDIERDREQIERIWDEYIEELVDLTLDYCEENGIAKPIDEEESDNAD